MAKPHKSCDMTSDDKFYKQGGITNGAAWYSVEGGMWHYCSVSGSEYCSKSNNFYEEQKTQKIVRPLYAFESVKQKMYYLLLYLIECRM